MRIIYVSTSISDASESIILFADGYTTLSSSVYPLMIDLSLIYRINTSVVNGVATCRGVVGKLKRLQLCTVIL